MATRPEVQFSETPEQQQQKSSGLRKALSWLFCGWRSKVSHEEINKNSSQGQTTIQPSAKVGENRATESGKVSYVAKVTHGVKPAAAGQTVKSSEEFGVESVDKKADDFIESQRKKLEMEKLISMKRAESMLNRGL